MRGISSYYLNAGVVCIYLGMLFTTVFIDNKMWSITFGICCSVSLFGWRENQGRMLRISESPISLIKSASQGYVELKGKAISLIPSRSPLRGIDAVWYRFWVYTKNASGIWNLAHFSSSQQLFSLQDGSGICKISPEGAEIIAADRYTQEQHGHKYIEDVIRTGQQVYVLGELNANHFTHIESQIQSETKNLITQWKQNMHALRLRFDENNDGHIDLFEWERARQLARAEVINKYNTLGAEQIPIIKKPSSDRPFLISGISPHTLRSRYQFWRNLHLVMLIAGLCALSATLIKNFT